MVKEQEKESSGEIKTVLGKGTKINGDIVTEGSVRVEGEITGKVEAEGDVFIGESGKIETEIKASKVVVAGNVSADITAAEKLEILASGFLKGNIITDKLVIKEGATFIGSSDKLDSEPEKNNSDSKNKNQ